MTTKAPLALEFTVPSFVGFRGGQRFWFRGRVRSASPTEDSGWKLFLDIAKTCLPYSVGYSTFCSIPILTSVGAVQGLRLAWCKERMIGI